MHAYQYIKQKKKYLKFEADQAKKERKEKSQIIIHFFFKDGILENSSKN